MDPKNRPHNFRGSSLFLIPAHHCLLWGLGCWGFGSLGFRVLVVRRVPEEMTRREARGERGKLGVQNVMHYCVSLEAT